MEKILFLTNIDHGAAEAMTKLMQDNGYACLIRRTVDDWLSDSNSEGTTLVIISQELPLDYLDTCRLIRNHSNVPIIILSDRSDTVDLVVALEMGADDSCLCITSDLSWWQGSEPCCAGRSLAKTGTIRNGLTPPTSRS